MRRLEFISIAALAVLVACNAAGDHPSSGTASPGESSGTTPAPSASGGSIPIAIPDPLNDVRHRAGETVEIDGATLVYRGLTERNGALFAAFDVTRGEMSEAQVRVGGEVFPLAGSGSIEAGPIDASRLERNGDLTVHAGNTLVVFEVGKVP